MGVLSAKLNAKTALKLPLTIPHISPNTSKHKLDISAFFLKYLLLQ